MKIDRRNPWHWLSLVAFFAQGLVGLLGRLVRRGRSERLVVLYGHKLNGNLRAVYDGLLAYGKPMTPIFLSMDRAYCDQLTSNGVAARWACGWYGAKVLARASAVVSDHGLHALEPLLPAYRRLRMRFYDVWHGIPFKGFDAIDFKLQHKYDEVWVASELMRDLYVHKFGFKPNRVVVTGYARTDRLVRRGQDPARLRASLDLPAEGVVLLFAPTWTQDSKGRSIYPFGSSEEEFLGALSSLATCYNATVVLRTHLNSVASAVAHYPRVISLPAASYPDTEEILMASDVLVCDWSSIAFDFLLLERPTLFLDVPAPFRKGFSLGPEYRFGLVVPDLQSLVDELEACVKSSEIYWSSKQKSHEEIKFLVYGRILDGLATKRCIDRIIHGTEGGRI